MVKATDDTPRCLNVAVLTVSDTRTEKDDTSGNYLIQALQDEGHCAFDKRIVIDDIYQIRAALSIWIANKEIHEIGRAHV